MPTNCETGWACGRIRSHGALRLLRAGLFAVFCLCFIGAKKPATEYGGSTGMSINGTLVFYNVLDGLGHEMARTGTLSPTLMERAEVIVFFQRSPAGVPRDVESWFQTWLSAREGRVVLFVGQEFDASVHFWYDVVHPPEGTDNDTRSSPLAQVEYKQSLLQLEAKGSTSIGSHHRRYPFVRESELAAAEVNVDADGGDVLAANSTKGARLYLRHYPDPKPAEKYEDSNQSPTNDRSKRLDVPLEQSSVSNAAAEGLSTNRFHHPPARFVSPFREIERADWNTPADVLLRVHGAPMVVSKRVGGGKVIIVANGSFLLNYSLINHEHRVLAVNLAEQLGPPRKIWFVADSRISSSTGMHGLKFPNPLAFLFVPPINWVVIHWLLVGAVFLLYKSPIFGRPRCPEESQLHRFSTHLKAYGKLLQQTRDKDYALTLIENYRANVKRGG